MSIVRNKPNRRRRTVNPPINQPELAKPVLITTAVAAASVLTLTFDATVSLKRGIVPQFTTDVAGATPVSAQQTGPNVVAITFSAAIAAATEINIPYRDPAIRNASGGYVTSDTFPI